MSLRCFWTLAWLLGAGCEAGTEVGPPFTPALDAPRTAELAVPLADGSLLVDDGVDLAIIRGEGAPRSIGDAGELGALRAYVWVDGSTLVAGSAGTFVVESGTDPGLFRAPIEDGIGGETIVALATTRRPDHASDVWVATDAALYLFRDETLVPIELDGGPVVGAALAPYVVPVDAAGSAAVWVGTSEGLYRLSVRPDAASFTALRMTQPEAARSIGTDQSGTLWIAGDAGLSALDLGLRFQAFAVDGRPVRVLASSDSDDVWIETERGFVLERDRVFRAASVALDGLLLGPGGATYARRGAAVSALFARHPIALEGLYDGPILEPTRVELRLPAIEHLVAVRAWAGNTELPVTPGSGATGPSFLIEPGPVPVGPHPLRVEADYDDGTLRAELRRPIEITTQATWTNDIEPLYARHCADCHGEAGPSPTRLDTLDAWRTLAERIVENVETGRMPLGRPALSSAEVARIQAWSSGGFPE
jgi:hypothetical protein